MAENIGTATVTIKPDTGNFDNEARSKLGGTFGGISKLGVAAFAAVGAAATGFVAKAISEAGELQKANAQTAAVIKSTGGVAGVSAEQISKLSESLGKVAGIESEVVQRGANMLLSFTNIKNEAGAGNDIFNQSVSTLGDFAAGMAAASGGEIDMAGSSIQLGKALNDPIGGLTSLGRVGVKFTDEQKALIKSMVEGGDTAGAQKVILAELNKEFGGSAKAAGDARTPIEQLQLKFKDVAESVGVNLMPVLAKLADKLLSVVDFLSTLEGPALRVAQAVGILAVVLGTLVVATRIFTAVQAALNIVLSANPIGLIVLAIVALVAVFVLAWKHSETFRNIVLGVFEVVKIAVEVAVTVFKKIIEVVGNIISWLVDKLGPSVGIVFEGVKLYVQGAILVFGKIIEVIGNIIGWLVDKLGPIVSTVFAIVKTQVEIAVEVFKKIVEVVGNIIGWIQDKLGPIIGTVFAGVKRAVQGGVDIFKKVVDVVGNIIEWIRDKLGPIVIPIIEGIGKAFDKVASAIDTVIGWIRKAIDWLGKLKVPDWLTPGSPSPLELTLTGIAKQLKTISGLEPMTLGKGSLGSMAAAGGFSVAPGAVQVNFNGSVDRSAVPDIERVMRQTVHELALELRS